MEQTFVFVYAKGNEIKVLNIEQEKAIGKKLIKDGWVHTQTLDACIFIQYLHNECIEADLIDNIKSLTKKSFKK